MEYCLADGFVRQTAKCAAASSRFVQRGTKREQITAIVQVLLAYLFGGHIRRRSDKKLQWL